MADGKSIIGDIFDTANNAIKKISEIELQRYEEKRMSDVRQIEDTARTQNQLQLAGYTIPQATQQSIVGGASLGAIALLTVALVLLVRG